MASGVFRMAPSAAPAYLSDTSRTPMALCDPPQTERSTWRLLLVDDEDVDAIAALRAMRRDLPGCTIERCEDLCRARELLKVEPFDLVIADHHLPDGFGTDLVGDPEHPPVVVMTGNEDGNIVLEAMRRGAYDFVLKTVNGAHLDVLAATALRALRRHDAERATLQEQVARRVLEADRQRLESFADIVAGALRAPLEASLHGCALLGPRLEASLDQRYLAMIEGGAKRSLEALHSLREIRAVTMARDEREPVELGRALEAATRSLHAELARAGVEVQHDELPTVQGSPRLLTRLFRELIQNAAAHGGIDSPTKVVIRAETRSRFTTVSIADRGPGFSVPTHRALLPFAKGHGVQRPGIGLAICERIVTLHGGSIRASDRDGGGAEIEFDLPLALRSPD